jgi:phosphoribosylaminoimidazolecarboxamide formyltransferase / IMP cyclohydrolase
MDKKIKSALISVFYKDELEPIVQQLHQLGITIYTTGGTQTFIEALHIPVVSVESLTTYPSILGGRVKTLHPSVFGGILGKRDDATHLAEMQQYHIPEIDLVIVDLYPFEETVATTTEEQLIIEKIDIGGPSMIRAAAKNFKDLLVVAAKKDYAALNQLLQTQQGSSTLAQRKYFATLAFEIVAHYDVAIAQYFIQQTSTTPLYFLNAVANPTVLRYGENPHQHGVFYGQPHQFFNQLHGKELSYNNLVDVEAALQLIQECTATTFGIIKHTNVCGMAQRPHVKDSWDAALAGDPESAFGGVLVCNASIEKDTATAINDIFFEVLIAPSFTEEALQILTTKKNRILLQQTHPLLPATAYKSVLNGVLVQAPDEGNFAQWTDAGGRLATEAEKKDLAFANIISKHLKSNAIAIVKNLQLIGKGCGQTSRIDALRHALEKAHQFKFNLNNAVMASDAFFPFNDCVQIAHQAGISAFIQPGGSIRDKDSIDYCQIHQLAMVITGLRHFKH